MGDTNDPARTPQRDAVLPLIRSDVGTFHPRCQAVTFTHRTRSGRSFGTTHPRVVRVAALPYRGPVLVRTAVRRRGDEGVAAYGNLRVGERFDGVPAGSVSVATVVERSAGGSVPAGDVDLIDRAGNFGRPRMSRHGSLPRCTRGALCSRREPTEGWRRRP